MSRPVAYSLAYLAPAPGLLQPIIRVIWNYRHHYIRLPLSPLWPPLMWGDW